MNRSRSFKVAYLLDANDLRGIGTAISDRVKSAANNEDSRDPVGDITYIVSLSDDTYMRTSNVEDVLSVENFQTKRIKTITLSSPRYGTDVHATISFKSSEQEKVVSYDVSGDPEHSHLLSEELALRVRSLRQWYWPLRYINFFWILIMSYAFLVVYAWSSPNIDSPISLIANVFGALFALVYICVAFCLEWCWRKLFPIATFLIGAEIKRHKRRMFIQSAVCLALLLGIISGLATGAIQTAIESVFL